MLATLLLFAVPLGLAAWIRHDMTEYAAFKQESDTRVRQGYFRRWTWQSFLALGGASILILLALARLSDALSIPVEFVELARGLQHESLAPGSAEADDYMLWTVIGMTIGVAAPLVVRMRRLEQAIAGDIAPLVPRNRAEILAVLPLAINAGLSEELFFRLALPLLITAVTGSAAVGVVGACLAFGLTHAYQGYKGVLATTLMGAMFTSVYLSSGSLLRPMLLHAVLDVVALVVRPGLARLVSGWQSRR